jgi:kynureninase
MTCKNSNAAKSADEQGQSCPRRLAKEWLLSLGFEIGSPLDSAQRGSHVSIKHLEAFRINRAMIDPILSGGRAGSPAVEGQVMRVIPDFRAPDNLRLDLAPIYSTFTDIHRAMARIRAIVATKEYEQFSDERAAVT